MEGRKKSLFSRPEAWLACALVLILAGSLLGGMFHSSFSKVKITEIEFETEQGLLNGLLYMPEGAGENDPRPVIVTTHGYLNTKEMQDAPAIELSRRGYIVLALDMYDHGDSRWKNPIPQGGFFGTFWVHSQKDAANYMAQQPYTLKDEKGNAYIAVSGHSMGGFSSIAAVYFDELAALERGTRNIAAALPVGADYAHFFASLIAPADQLMAAMGSRTIGFIGGHFDEFFFNKTAEEMSEEEKKISGTVVYKDYAAINAGKTFLGLPPDGEAGEPGRFYTVASGELKVQDAVARASEEGEHVIYTPYETHPWNHFSKETTGNMIDFYNHAFRDVAPAGSDIPAGSQIWVWKEFFNCVALVGFFLLMVPLCLLLARLPFLKKAVAEERPAITPAKKGQGWIVLAAVALGTFIPAIFFGSFMDKKPVLAILAYVSLAAALLGVIAVFAMKKSKSLLYMSLFALILAGVLYFAKSLIIFGSYFVSATANQILFWGIVSGLLTAVITTGVYACMKKPDGTVFAAYGIQKSPAVILASLLTALLAVLIGYALLFLMQALFGVDFRVWTLAVRTVKAENVIAALRYLPFFFIYYFANAVAIGANTRGRKCGWLLGAAMNVLGLVIWVALQYGLLFARGVSLEPDQALNGILLFALIPCLALAGIYANRLSEKTNNMWLPAFLNTILFTMITLGNTAIFWNLQ